MARQPKARGQVRIIGGRWRSRRIEVADVPDLRPTGDRSRETLFNWLGHDLGGLACADLFAGSGALGFEALSRGAARCEFVENHRRAVAVLKQSAEVLGAPSHAFQLFPSTVEAWITRPVGRPEDSFDLIFADPPYANGGWSTLLSQIEARLRPGARVFIESPKASVWTWPDTYFVQRETTVGEARLRLFSWAG